jgi:tripartite motif-containing protein 37
VYSEHLVTNGIKWRLKIYPHGNGNAKNIYLSIFLEMDSKYSEVRRYEYKIEMLN